MIFQMIKNKLFGKKKEEPKIQYSSYFPQLFFTGRRVTIDDGIVFFLTDSVFNFMTNTFFVKEIKNWQIGSDKFEEIIFEDNFKMIYDVSNDLFYLLEKAESCPDQGNIVAKSLTFRDRKFDSFVSEMEIDGQNKLLSIFNRKFSEEADDYVFKELDNNLIETTWIGIIIQVAMIT